MELSKEQLDKMAKAREERCRPIVNKMLVEMIREDVLMADLEYIESVIRQEIESMFKIIVLQHSNVILGELNTVLTTALRMYEKQKFGKNPEDITIKDIDQGVRDLVNAQKKERKSK